MVMFINEFDYYLMDMVPNVCSIQFPGVPNCFDYIGIRQRSPKVMKVGKSVYFIYPGFLKMFTVAMFTYECQNYLLDIVPNVCSIRFPVVPNYFDRIGIWQRSPKVMKVGKGVYFIYHWCLMMSPVFKFTIIFTYYLLDIDQNTQSIQSKGVPNF